MQSFSIAKIAGTRGKVKMFLCYVFFCLESNEISAKSKETLNLL